MPILTFPHPRARSADAYAITVDLKIVTAQGMITDAVRLLGIYCRGGLTAVNVDSLAYRLQMSWIHARGVTAQVIQNLTIRYRAYVDLVGDPMRKLRYSVNHQASIPVLVMATCPQPAGFRFLYPGPESLFKWAVISTRTRIANRTASTDSRVVHCAQAAPFGPPTTSLNRARPHGGSIIAHPPVPSDLHTGLKEPR